MNERYHEYVRENRESNFDERIYNNEKLKYEYYLNKRRKKIIGIAFIGSSLVMYSILKLFTDIENLNSSLISLSLIIIGLVILLLNYLQSDTSIFINGEKIPIARIFPRNDSAELHSVPTNNCHNVQKIVLF